MPKPPPRSGLTVSALQASAILAGLQAAGADALAVMARAGLTPEDLGDARTRIARETILEFWQAALDVTGDKAFGLHLAEQVAAGSLDVIDYLARSSATLGDAFARAARYMRLVDDVAELVALDDADARTTTFAPRLAHGLAIPEGVMECVFAATLRTARETTATPIVPRAVSFTHAPPDDAREHRRIFGIDVTFRAPSNGLTLSHDDLARPLVTADPALSAILDRHAQELLARLPKVTLFRDRVRALLAAELRGGGGGGGGGGVETIAARLHMSARTLRRRLEDEGTTPQALLDELRHELAVRYVDEQKMTLDEVAFEVGFADTRAFRRAFKRWTGRTPRG